MQRKAFVIFDDYVMGATTSAPAYSASRFNEVLSQADRFTLQAVVDNVTASPSSLTWVSSAHRVSPTSPTPWRSPASWSTSRWT